MGNVKDIDLSEFENGAVLKLPWYKRIFTACVSYVRYTEQVSKLRDAIKIYREEDKKSYESLEAFYQKNVELIRENEELKDEIKGKNTSLITCEDITVKLKEELLSCAKRNKDLEDELNLLKSNSSNQAKNLEFVTAEENMVKENTVKKCKAPGKVPVSVNTSEKTKTRISKNNKEFAYIEEYVNTLSQTDKDMMVHDILDVYANDVRLSERVEKYFTNSKFEEDRYYLILRTALARKRMSLKKYYDAVEAFRKKGK